MKWSLKIGEFAGIGVYVHVTFLVLIAWIAFSYWVEGQNLALVLSGVGFILALFGCVVLHEFGHALAARKYGIRTRDITLLPIGGVARLERMPDVPIQELWVALAGPAVNLIIAIVLFGWLIMTAALEPLTRLTVVRGSFLARLLMINVLLAGFNLLPAFPMDGGRVLRALLAMRLEYTQATHVAASIGQGFAFLLGFLGLLFNPLLIFTALFVWIGAAQEASLVQMKSALGGIPVRRAMLTDFRTLAANDSLARAIELLLAGSQQDFPVMDGERVVGVLTRNDLLKALAGQDTARRVTEVMQREFEMVDALDMLETAFGRLQRCGCHTLPVTHAGQLVGLITADNIGEFMMIQAALQPRRSL